MIILQTDGVSKDNPGPAAFAFIIKDLEGIVITGGGGRLGEQSNNYAEYMAVVAGLKESLRLGFTGITVKTDSMMMIKHVTRGLKIESISLKRLVRKIQDLIHEVKEKGGVVKFVWISRLENQELDSLANRVLIDGIDNVRREEKWKTRN
jgi:ribonuclease HI